MSLQSWLPISKTSNFSIFNLPYGIFETNERTARVGVAIEDFVLDLVALSELGLLKNLNISTSVFSKLVLNDLMATGKKNNSLLRKRLQELLSIGNEELKPYTQQLLIPRDKVRLKMPLQIGDYTDFYSSLEHATNVGKMFRDPENALLPNWKRLPVGYHGRASSIVVSGTPIHRPMGQILPKGTTQPAFQATQKLDFELEMGFVIGKESPLGKRISTAEATDYIFGLCLFNDWSARDIQKWEYVPLGPFLGKNFASSISPWIVPLEALEPFRVAGKPQEPLVLPYLKYNGNWNYNIPLEVELETEEGIKTIISRSNYKHLYWTMPQQLAHHTVNGCNVKVGDLMASGTISGTTPDSYGSMLELSWSGTKEIALADGSTRYFLADGDKISLKSSAVKDDIRIDFGMVEGQIVPMK